MPRSHTLHRAQSALIAVPLLGVAVLGAACNNGSDDVTVIPSTPTAISTETATPAATPTPTPSPTPSTDGEIITPENVSMLAALGHATLEPVPMITLGQDGALVAQTQSAVLILDPVTVEERASIDFGDRGVPLGVADDGSLIAFRGEGSAIDVFDAEGDLVQTIDPGTATTSVTFIDGNRQVALTSGDTIEVTLWSLADGRPTDVLQGFETAAPVYSILFSPDGQRAAWISRGTLQTLEIVTGSLGERLEFESFIGSAVFSRDGSTLVTITGQTVQAWDAATGTERWRADVNEILSDVAISHDGVLVAVAEGDIVRFYLAADGTDAGTLNVGERAPVRGVAFSPDGRILAAVAENGAVTTWTGSAP